jgi:hypothetical protein
VRIFVLRRLVGGGAVRDPPTVLVFGVGERSSAFALGDYTFEYLCCVRSVRNTLLVSVVTVAEPIESCC